MGKARFIHLLLGLILVFSLLIGFIAVPMAVSADDPSPTPTGTATPLVTPTPTPTPGTSPSPVVIAAPTSSPSPQPSLSLDCTYPVIQNNSGQSYTFSVDIHYAGPSKMVFNISATAPQDWTVTTTAGYPEAEISAIEINSSNYQDALQTVKVNLSPNQGYYPDPGDYKVTLKVSSDTLSQSMDLTATVKARYSIAMSTDTGNLSTTATAGKDNHFSFKISNNGSASVDNINFTSTPPQGWVVNFNPTSIASLGANQIQQVDAVIKPPEGKTIAGDYMVTLNASNGPVSATAMDVRVTVVTPSIWGWVGIIIVVLVIAALGVLFMRLGRR